MENYSFFDDITQAEEDPILGLPILFNKDPRKDKVNLGIGSFKTAEGRSLLLESVQKAETALLQQKSPRDYLPIEGDARFNLETIRLVLGEHAPLDQVLCFQTIGGTQGLRLGGEFLAQHLASSIYISSPSWSNHELIFSSAGLSFEHYPYYDSKNHQIVFDQMVEKIKKMAPGSVILLQAANHNPTGANLSKKQWEELASLIPKLGVLPFFDTAYQGFGSSLEEDVFPIRLFMEKGIEMLIAHSCSKNFGLYGERVGALLFVSHHAESLSKVGSQLKKIVRSFCSTPPVHGGKVVAEILSQPVLKALWKEEVEAMRQRVTEMRKLLVEELRNRGSEAFDFILQREGFFALLGMSNEQVLKLRQDKGLYIPLNSRINIAGITQQNSALVADAILSIL